MAGKLGAVPAIPRTVARHTHWGNVPTTTSKDYNRQALAIYLLDKSTWRLFENK